MQLKTNEIHVWYANLSRLFDQEGDRIKILDQIEVDRAMQFHTRLHQQRFIAARSILKELLGQYLGQPPASLHMQYSEHKKPFIASSENVQFNLAHSEDIAVYAFALNQSIGIDIERIKNNYNPAIAKRFYSNDENEYLANLPTAEKAEAFYRVWARKEALVKAIGKGLFLTLSHFSVAGEAVEESIIVENQPWYLYPLNIQAGYQSALACQQPQAQIIKRDFFLPA